MSESEKDRPAPELDDPREEKRVDVPPEATPVVTPGPTGQPAEGTVTPAENEDAPYNPPLDPYTQ